jgi:hypothetical protein
VIAGSNWASASPALVLPVVSISLLEYARPYPRHFEVPVAAIRLPVSVRQFGSVTVAAVTAGFDFAFSAVVAQPNNAAVARITTAVRPSSCFWEPAVQVGALGLYGQAEWPWIGSHRVLIGSPKVSTPNEHGRGSLTVGVVRSLRAEPALPVLSVIPFVARAFSRRVN